MQPVSGNQCSDLLTCLMDVSLVLYHACHPKFIFADSPQTSHACHRFETVRKPTHRAQFCKGVESIAPGTKTPLNAQKWSEGCALLLMWLLNVLRAATPCTFSTSQLPKALWDWGVSNLLTSKIFQVCATRACVHFFEISTSNSSRAEVSLAFLRNVLRTTAACNCWSVIRSKASAPAALASLLFDPPGPQNIGENAVFRNFSPDSLLSDFFSSLTLLTTAASSVHKSEVRLL